MSVVQYDVLRSEEAENQVAHIVDDVQKQETSTTSNPHAIDIKTWIVGPGDVSQTLRKCELRKIRHGFTSTSRGWWMHSRGGQAASEKRDERDKPTTNNKHSGGDAAYAHSSQSNFRAGTK